jgi:hypothetical protein
MIYRYLLRFVLIQCFWVLSCSVRAQQLNIGVHLNPALTVPFTSDQSVYDKQIKKPGLRLGYNIGVDVNYTSGNVNVNSGFNLVQKSLTYKTNTRPETGGLNSFKLTYFSHSYELPFLLSYNVHRHDWNDIVYDLYLSGGFSYEMNKYYGVSWTFTSVNTNSGNVYSDPIDDQLLGTSGKWVNFIFGFKVNTIIQKIGLIDYGLTWHIPLAETDAYSVESRVKDIDNNIDHTITGKFYQRLSYVNIKLCYYFLNYDRNLKRIKYKEGGYFYR